MVHWTGCAMYSSQLPGYAVSFDFYTDTLKLKLYFF